jgi:hypothetical protein
MSTIHLQGGVEMKWRASAWTVAKSRSRIVLITRVKVWVNCWS